MKTPVQRRKEKKKKQNELIAYSTGENICKLHRNLLANYINDDILFERRQTSG